MEYARSESSNSALSTDSRHDLLATCELTIAKERDLFMSRVYKQHHLLCNQQALSIVQNSPSNGLPRHYSFRAVDPSQDLPRQNPQERLSH